MRKTMLTALVAASVLAAPAFAQVSLGGAGQVGGGITAGGALPGSMPAAGRLGPQVDRTADGLGRRTRSTSRRLGHMAHANAQHGVDRAQSALDDNGRASAHGKASGSADVNADGKHAGVGAGTDAGGDVDAGQAARQATATGLGASQTARQAARSSVQRAGTAGNAAAVDHARQVGTPSTGISANGQASGMAAGSAQSGGASGGTVDGGKASGRAVGSRTGTAGPAHSRADERDH